MTAETATIVQTWASIGGVLATLLVGAAQSGLIWIGLRQMRAASESRDRQLDEQGQVAADRHTETMEALRSQGDALRAVVRGLETVIERTAPGKR